MVSHGCVFACIMLTASLAIAQQPASTPKSIVWEMDTLIGFTKAIENTRLFVVVFGNQPLYRSNEGTNFTNQLRDEFEKPTLVALRNDAVFAIGYPDADEYARRMAMHLKLTVYPTVSVIDSRTDKLTELYRKEGFCKAEDLAKELAPVLAAHNKKYHPQKEGQPPTKEQTKETSLPEVTLSKLIPSNKTYEKKDVTAADLTAIKKAISEYEAAYKVGDVEKVINISAEPFRFAMRESFDHVKLVGQAKRNLLTAMDEKFGKDSGIIPYGTDDDKIRQRMRRVTSFYLMEHETNLGLNVTCTVEAKFTNDKTELWKLVAVRQPDGAWKLWPHKADGLSELNTTQAWQVNMTRLAQAYDEVTIMVQAGKLKSREDTMQAAFGAYSRVMSPMSKNAPSHETTPPTKQDAPAKTTNRATQEREEATAKALCLQFEHAVRSYQREKNRWPTALNELLGKYIDHKTINDPWGNPLRYATARDTEGKETVHIWTLSPYDQKVIGSNPKLVEKSAPDEDHLATAQEGFKQLLRIYKEVVPLFDQATDAAAARRVKPQLDKLSQEIVAIEKRMKSLTLTSNQQQGLRLMFEDQMDKPKEAYFQAHRNLVLKRPEAYRELVGMGICMFGERDMVHNAELDVSHLEHHVKLYFDKHRAWPRELSDLQGEPNFKAHRLIDPWDKPYKYEIDDLTGDKNAAQNSKRKPYIWTTSPFPSGKKVIGNMPLSRR